MSVKAQLHEALRKDTPTSDPPVVERSLDRMVSMARSFKHRASQLVDSNGFCHGLRVSLKLRSKAPNVT